MHSTIIEYNILRKTYPKITAQLILDARSKIRILNTKDHREWTERDKIVYEEYLRLLSDLGTYL